MDLGLEPYNQEIAFTTRGVSVRIYTQCTHIYNDYSIHVGVALVVIPQNFCPIIMIYYLCYASTAALYYFNIQLYTYSIPCYCCHYSAFFLHEQQCSRKQSMVTQTVREVTSALLSLSCYK